MGCGCSGGGSTTSVDKKNKKEEIRDFNMLIDNYQCVNPDCRHTTLLPYRSGSLLLGRTIPSYSCPMCNSELKMLETNYLLR